MDENYNVILHGVDDAFEVEEAIENLAGLFNCAHDKARAALSIPNNIIKRDITKTLAERYQTEIQRTGAVCIIEPVSSVGEVLNFSLPTAPSVALPYPAQYEADGLENTEKEELSFEEATQIFIGSNHAYYLREWERAENMDYQYTWNWAAFFSAFFTGIGWLFYRKMYIHGAGAVALITPILYFLKYNFILGLTFIVIIATLGWHTNQWYKLHVHKNVREILEKHPPEEARLILARRGGVNIGALLLSLFFLYIYLPIPYLFALFITSNTVFLAILFTIALIVILKRILARFWA